MENVVTLGEEWSAEEALRQLGRTGVRGERYRWRGKQDCGTVKSVATLRKVDVEKAPLHWQYVEMQPRGARRASAALRAIASRVYAVAAPP